mgnify:FL=1
MIRRKLDNHWYIDSGATKHMTFEKDLIVDFMKYEQPSKIYLGDNRVIEARLDSPVMMNPMLFS